MDPLTHTLAGAGLAQTRLGRLGDLPGRLAAGTLIVGANLPDVDVVCYFVGSDFALAHRRGWTHGVLAMVALPVALAAGVWLLGRARRRRRGESDRGAAARFGPLLALATIAVWSHPLLDWLNTYGVRFLAPFDWTWFYGDAVYIVDPWLWLLLGGALFLAHSGRPAAVLAWTALASVATRLVLGAAPPPAGGVWLAALGLLALARWRGWRPRAPAAAERLATVALAAAGLYVAAMVISGMVGRAIVQARLAGSVEGRVVDLMVGPEAADPFHRQVVVETEAGYRLGRLDGLGRAGLELEPELVPPPEPTPPVRAALRAPSVHGMVVWMRFPTFVVTPEGAGYRVDLVDLRYARRPGSGFGTATVRLGPDLEPAR